MNIKLFVLLFCVDLIGRSCAEIKNARVKDLIEKLKNFAPPSHASLPTYLQNINQFQEYQEPSTSSAPNLKRHHLVSGNQLKQLYKILLENSPETLIEMFYHIYYNLPAAWRDKNVEYLHALLCLDDTVANEDVDKLEECEGSVKSLFNMFFWRPDNIQVGPGDRFRDGGAGYDYDCFYLLRGVEMIYNIEFRTAIEAVIDADYTGTGEEHGRILQSTFNRLLRASHRMITNRNVPRNYNPSEWIPVDSNVCKHGKPFQNSINMLEKTFDLKQQEFRTINNAQHTLIVQSMNRLVAWIESVLKTYVGRKNKKLQKLADQIKKECNRETFTELMWTFMTTSERMLNVPEFMDFIMLFVGDTVITPNTLTADYWLKLYENYISGKATVDEQTMNEELKKLNKNKKLVTVLNLLRANKGRSDAAKGYISNVYNIIKYNTYFMSRYLGAKDLTLEELYSMSCIDTNNVTSTVKDFKELRKKEDDDDEEKQDKNKNLSTWYTLLTGVYRLYEHKGCAPHVGESIQNIVDSKKKNYCLPDANDPTKDSLFNIMNKIQATEKISPDIKECSANMNIRGNTRIRAQRDVGDKSKQEKQLQLRQLVEEVFQNINSTYQYDRATVLYQMVANRMHPLIKQSLNTVCHIPDSEVVNSNCEGYRYPGCYWDQPALEKATIIMDKMTCHGLNILSFGIGYFFNKC